MVRGGFLNLPPGLPTLPLVLVREPCHLLFTPSFDPVYILIFQFLGIFNVTQDQGFCPGPGEAHALFFFRPEVVLFYRKWLVLGRFRAVYEKKFKGG